jgi:gliding motility-associated-like protein
VNISITDITYSVGGGGTGAIISPSLPTGLTGFYAGGIYTIIGTPSTSGTYNYTITTSGSCAQTFTVGSITVNPDATLSLSSASGTDTQTVCVNTSITDITYSVGGGGTGAIISPALPSGLSGSYVGGVYTISGTPSTSGTYTYTLTTTGVCVQTFTVGSITINPDASITLTSAVGTDTQTVCVNTSIVDITYLIGGGGTGAIISPSLPTGLTGFYAGGIYTIIGTPNTAGTYNYTITTSGSCAQTFTVGSITVNPDATLSLSSALGTDTQRVCVNTPITDITYSVGGGGTGAIISPALPSGLTGSYAGGVYTISGIPGTSGTYTYTLTTTGVCVQTFTVGSITVNPDASIALTSTVGTDTQTVCVNTSITDITYLIGGGGTGAIISPSLPSGLTGSYAGGIYTIIGTPASIGTYNYTITTTGTCIQTYTVGSITVSPNASVGSASGTSPLCIGGTDTYTLSSVVLGGGIGKWISSDTTIAKVDSVTGLVTGVSVGTCDIGYNIIGGCGVTGTISAIPQSLTINPNMSAGSVNGITPLCIGGTTTYSANAVVLSGGTGAWSSDDITIATVDSTGIVTGVSSGTCNIVYTVSGGCGATVFSSKQITINPDASIASLSGTTPLCIGSTATYTANAVVLSGGTGVWSSSDTTIATVNSSTGVVTGIAAGTCDIIYTITGGCGVAGTISVTKSVTITPNMSVGTVSGLSPLCIGSTATYIVSSVVLSGGIGAWTSSSPARATIDPVTGAVTGVSAGSSNIIYTISGGCGVTVSSAPQAVTINPNASVLALTGLPQAVCIGGTTTYAPFGEVLSGGIAVWSSTNTAMATVDQTGIVTGISAGISDIVYTISGGCGGDVSYDRPITVHPDASITLTSALGTDSQAVCANSPITTITYTIGGSGGVPTIVPALPTGLTSSFTAGVYTINGTPSVFGIFNHTLITTGICAPDTALLSFTISAVPVINSAFAKTICSGVKTDLALTSAGVPSNYSWIATNNFVTSGESTITQSTDSINDIILNPSINIELVTYTVIPTSISGGCVGAAQTITITANPIPSLNGVLTSSVICSGVAINYNTSSATAGATFAWTRPAVNGIIQPSGAGTGNITESLNDTTINPVNVTYTIITTANNCSNSGEDVTVTIAPVSIASPASQTVCSGTTTEIKLTSPVNGTSFSWTFNENGVSGATIGNSNTINNTLISTQTTYGTATYTIVPSYTVTTSSSCAGIPVVVSVVVNPTVIADAGKDAYIDYGKSVQIGGTPSGPSGSTYVWSPSMDVNDITLANPTVSPKYKMVYTIVATNIVNGVACSGTDDVEIKVPTPVYLVNGFTPNGDGVNDTWDIDFIGGYPNAVVEVFNRWGELVFQSQTGYKTKWNGIYNGGLLPVGTYYYIINLNDPEHPTPYTGPVTIMR